MGVSRATFWAKDYNDRGASQETCQLLSELDNHLEDSSYSWEEILSLGIYLLRHSSEGRKTVLSSLRVRSMDPGNYNADPWTCADCWGLCLGLLSQCGVFCGREPNPNSNVLINDLVHKYWTPSSKPHPSKSRAMISSRKGHLNALEVYSEAVRLNPIDASIRNNPEVAIKLRPNWTKAYYRKSAALCALDREEEAFKTLYQCLILDKDPSVLIQNELCSLLTHMNLSYQEEVDEKTLKILERFPALKAKQRESKQVVHMIKDASQSIEKFLRGAVCPRRLPVDPQSWTPRTTSCLDRFLDHKPLCALCKFDLADFLATRNGASCEFIVQSLRRLLPDAYDERKKLHEQETRDLIGKETLFLCVPWDFLPFHTMIRRCMETGTREFGMCPPGTSNAPGQKHQILPDGRSIVGTVGGRRFHVLSRSSRDGYSVANVEFLVDEAITDEDVIA
ncbi:LON peptidase Nterminal domain and ring finger 3, partial [Caligus rogercresseyi]